MQRLHGDLLFLGASVGAWGVVSCSRTAQARCIGFLGACKEVLAISQKERNSSATCASNQTCTGSNWSSDAYCPDVARRLLGTNSLLRCIILAGTVMPFLTLFTMASNGPIHKKSRKHTWMRQHASSIFIQRVPGICTLTNQF